MEIIEVQMSIHVPDDCTIEYHVYSRKKELKEDRRVIRAYRTRLKSPIRCITYKPIYINSYEPN